MLNIHPKAIIDPQAKIHNSSIISAYVVILGKVKIHENCHIGEFTKIGSLPVVDNKINKTIINDVEIKKGSVIGSNVVIQAGATKTTKIGRNCRINHNSSIGHDVEIGDDCFIGLNNSISGYSKIGNNVKSGPGCTFNNRSSVGNNSVIGIGSLVLHPIQDNQVVIGRPAIDIKIAKKNKAKYMNLINENYISKKITKYPDKFKFLRIILKPIYIFFPKKFKRILRNIFL